MLLTIALSSGESLIIWLLLAMGLIRRCQGLVPIFHTCAKLEIKRKKYSVTPGNKHKGGAHRQKLATRQKDAIIYLQWSVIVGRD